MVSHTHDFFEIAMALSGSSEHITGEKPFAFSMGEILFVNNQKRHRFKATTDDFYILNVCFLPRVFGYPDDLPTENQNFSLYSIFSPFAETSADGDFKKIAPPGAEFKKMSFLALRLAELSGLEDPTRGDEMAFLLNALLSQMKEHLQLSENEGPHFLHEVLQYLHAHFQERITLDLLANRFGLNRSHFSTTFNEKVGMRIDAYLKHLRIEKSRALLRETHLPISRIAVEVGFENSSHFTKAFREKTGLSPSEYRKLSSVSKSPETLNDRPLTPKGV